MSSPPRLVSFVAAVQLLVSGPASAQPTPGEVAGPWLCNTFRLTEEHVENTMATWLNAYAPGGPETVVTSFTSQRDGTVLLNLCVWDPAAASEILSAREEYDAQRREGERVEQEREAAEYEAHRREIEERREEGPPPKTKSKRFEVDEDDPFDEDEDEEGD